MCGYSFLKKKSVRPYFLERHSAITTLCVYIFLEKMYSHVRLLGPV